MDQSSASTKDREAFCNVISFTIHADKDESGGAELLVRAKGAWFYSSIDPKDLSKSSGIKAQPSPLDAYERMRSNAIKFQKKKEAEIMGQAHDAENGDNAKEPVIKKRKTDSSHDSGYESSHENERASHVDEQDNIQDEDPEQKLQNWMLAPLAPHFSHLTPDKSPQSSKFSSLTEWYNAPLHFFRLASASSSSGDSSLEAHLRDDIDEKSFRSRNLQHALNLPKDLRSAAPWYSPDDVLVIREADDIHLPLHPTLVRLESAEEENDDDTSSRSCKPKREIANSATHFLKLVPDGPGSRHSIVREISHLQKLHKLQSQKPDATTSLRFPRLRGFIAPPLTKGSRATILGFILELVPDPTPLTDKFTTSIPSEKRARWARDAQAMVDVLHAHGITWGDAKADNFLVAGTAGEELWMIDFGGGFTEGWVAEGKCETRDGDREGVGKIVGGLEDPEGATEGGEVESHQGGEGKKKKKGRGRPRKRKAGEM